MTGRLGIMLLLLAALLVVVGKLAVAALGPVGGAL